MADLRKDRMGITPIHAIAGAAVVIFILLAGAMLYYQGNLGAYAKYAPGVDEHSADGYFVWDELEVTYDAYGAQVKEGRDPSFHAGIAPAPEYAEFAQYLRPTANNVTVTCMIFKADTRVGSVHEWEMTNVFTMDKIDTGRMVPFYVEAGNYWYDVTVTIGDKVVATAGGPANARA